MDMRICRSRTLVRWPNGEEVSRRDIGAIMDQPSSKDIIEQVSKQ